MIRRFPHVYFNSVLMLVCFLMTTEFIYWWSITRYSYWNQKRLVGKHVRQIRYSQQHSPTDYVTYPWIGDSTCQHFTVQFAINKSRPAWALTSFPGSGVTWTRQLVEGVTGIYTGTAYGKGEPGIIDGNYYGNDAELDCGCTILIKDHGYPVCYDEIGKDDPYQQRGILLLRNPFDALFTFAHFLWSGRDQKGIASLDFFNGTEWNNHVDYVALQWAEHAVRWIGYIKKGTVIFYERLLEDTKGELEKLLHSINFTDTHHPFFDPERMRCTLIQKNRLDRKRKRKPMIPLTQQDHSKIMFSIYRVQENLRKKGWPLLPLHLYNVPKLGDL